MQPTTVVAVRAVDEPGAEDGADGSAPTRLLVKLAESPFYAAGGGQISDIGTIECEHGDCRARVEDVLAVGQDRIPEVIVEAGTLDVGEQVLARVDHLARHKTECNHTATHLLQAALRERVGSHVRQAGSYVGPDKLRFDFSHGQALSAEELRDVEDRVNAWIARNDPVRAITTTLEEARRLGAMALFGEKYGEVVRMVEVGEGDVLARAVRRHPRALDRRDRRVSHPPRDLELRQRSTHRGRHRSGRRSSCCASTIACWGRWPQRCARTPEDAPAAVRTLAQERKRLEKALKEGGGGGRRRERPRCGVAGERAHEVGGASVLAAAVEVADAKALLDAVDRAEGSPAPTRRSCSARPPTDACISSRASPRRWSSAVSGRAPWSRPPPRSSEGAAAGATRWPRPAGATPSGSRRRSTRGARRSSGTGG